MCWLIPCIYLFKYLGPKENNSNLGPTEKGPSSSNLAPNSRGFNGYQPVIYTSVETDEEFPAPGERRTTTFSV